MSQDIEQNTKQDTKPDAQAEGQPTNVPDRRPCKSKFDDAAYERWSKTLRRASVVE
jgi:hypothetical protein